MNPLKVLIIGKVWPEPESSAAGTRMMELIDTFLSQKWSVTFATAAAESEYAADLKSLKVDTKNIQLNDASFDVFVKNLNPDLVLFDRFMTEEQFGWRVAEQVPNALRILDTEDLHSLRIARQAAWKKGKPVETADLFNETAKREIASILRCDLSLIISKKEMELLQTTFGVNKELLFYLPFMLDGLKLEDLKNRPKFEERAHFISIGNFLHEPNWNAVLYLKEDIWPQIRQQLADAELHIYGAYASQKVEQLHNTSQGFLVKGRAESASQVVEKARVLLAPIRFGAGLKGKLIEAMQCGTPSVTTQIGAEAMHGNHPWPGAVANHPKEFVKQAVELYNYKQSWSDAQQKALPIINSLYNKQEHAGRLLERIHSLLGELEEHRLQNFMGVLLQHHTAQSTKFMSRWIEEKNRK